MDVGSSLQCLNSAGLVRVVVNGCCYVITSKKFMLTSSTKCCTLSVARGLGIRLEGFDLKFPMVVAQFTYMSILQYLKEVI